MIEKLKLSFCLSSDLGTPQEEEAIRYFGKEMRTALETFSSGLNLSIDEAGLLAFAKKYLETPVILHPLFEPRAHKELATHAHNRILQLFDEIDKASFELTKEGVEPEAAFLLPKRLERLRAEFEIWREAITSGNFEVYQTRPYEKMPEHFEQFPNLRTQYNPNNTGRFPAMKFEFLWQPETAKVKKEPEEFRYNRLIWNGQKNALAYIFYQLKNEHITEKRKPFLEASNEDLAEFLKANFECFKDSKITSIMAHFENPDKHPKKSNEKFIVSRGMPPKH